METNAVSSAGVMKREPDGTAGPGNANVLTRSHEKAHGNVGTEAAAVVMAMAAVRVTTAHRRNGIMATFLWEASTPGEQSATRVRYCRAEAEK